MPTISMFYGIVILMYYKDIGRHSLPHIHARYQEYKASVDIQSGVVLEGELPPKQLRLVQAWVDIHQEELITDWELAVTGIEPFRIAPLQ